MCIRDRVNAKLALSGQVVYTFVTKEMFDTFGCGKEETDGIVDRIRVIDLSLIHI